MFREIEKNVYINIIYIINIYVENPSTRHYLILVNEPGYVMKLTIIRICGGHVMTHDSSKY